MNKITVTSQQQLDSLPHDYHGRIYIKFGTPYDMAIVRMHLKLRHPAMHALCEIRVPLTMVLVLNRTQIYNRRIYK